LSNVRKGVAYTGVNIRDLKRFPVPVPPIAEQHEIVRRVEALLAPADEIEARATTGLAHSFRNTEWVIPADLLNCSFE
jgi:type I restriction enzyme S subunit